MKKLIIIGAGGHGKVLADTVLQAGSYELIGFVDANLSIGTPVFSNFNVIENQSNLLNLVHPDTYFVLGIGDNYLREKIVNQFPTLNWATLIHPKAACSSAVEIGEGTVVLANSVVSALVKIGKHGIVNAGTIIDHESQVGDFVHLSVGTKIGSNCVVSKYAKTAVGAVFQPFTQL